MDQENSCPQCSKTKSNTIKIQTNGENDDNSVILKVSREIISHNLEIPAHMDISKKDNNLQLKLSMLSMPLTTTNNLQAMNKPLCISSNLPSTTSLKETRPLTLFIQALAKLNESSISLAIPKTSLFQYMNSNTKFDSFPLEISPPDSLTSAPPSYSFVLRQMAARRRPRLMGTFIPSPSFVQHTPPPNYTTAFDIYVDPMPPPPQRVYNFGFTPMPIVCPECGYTGMTMISSKITLCTHLCAIMLCLLCCWICAPLPYALKSCKDVYHYCRNCRHFLGRYCPTNPEGVQNYS